MNSYPVMRIAQKVFTIIGVILFCFAVVTYSKITILSSFIPFSHSPALLHIFEGHFWQFCFAFTAIVFLSRGHLWSYGINSQNLKTSMQWLGWLYGVVIVGTIVLRVLNVDILPIEKDALPAGIRDTVVSMLIYWMSSPVANQILFFGFAQTIFMKQVGDDIRIAGVPLIIFVSSALFTLLVTNSSLNIGVLSAVSTFVVGFYSGVVYWKTGSLITPMLGHGFVFGFPLFVEFIFSNAVR